MVVEGNPHVVLFEKVGAALEGFEHHGVPLVLWDVAVAVPAAVRAHDVRASYGNDLADVAVALDLRVQIAGVGLQEVIASRYRRGLHPVFGQ